MARRDGRGVRLVRTETSVRKPNGGHLKPGPNQGRLALWIDAGTEAWFSDIVVVK